MQRFSQLAILALVFAASVSQAQTSISAGPDCKRTGDSNAERNSGKAATDHDLSCTNDLPDTTMPGLEFLRKIDKGIIKEFDRAWHDSGNGTTGREGVVLIFRMYDGSYIGRLQGFTNEYKRFTFKWNPATLAIIHTHPNKCDPRPGEQDKLVADKYGVPNVTLTNNGMYVYDPATKKTTKVLNGLDWLNPSIWTQEIAQERRHLPTPGSGIWLQADSCRFRGEQFQ